MRYLRKGNLRTFLLMALCGLYNFAVYCTARFITSDRMHYNITTPLDEAIPFIPAAVYIYWGCVIFWIVNYYIGINNPDNDTFRFFKAHIIGETVCFFVFVFFPATMDRPVIAGTGIAESILKLTYEADRADNLLPSIHCFVSWLCFAGIRGIRGISGKYRVFSLIMALMVCISTLLVKQHVIFDVIAGVMLAELSWFIAG